jgi:[glutamine synthetase] adenylyltransferase / [glutamine synthetase]-adenylyl-L-tyrosine phosphorylase
MNTNPDDGTAWFGTPATRLWPLDPESAAEFIGDLKERARDEGLARLERLLDRDTPLRSSLGAVFDLSPFMRDVARRRPAVLDALHDRPLQDRVADLVDEAKQAALPFDQSEKDLMRRLRLIKGEAHFLIGLADILGVAEAPQIVAWLSDLAEASLRAAVDFLLHDCHRRGKLTLADPEQPSRGSGLIVLGMGKLGAGELNYSSDIDIIVFFDPEVPAVVDRLEATDLFARLARGLVRIMQDRTEHGYVFRTDLRLRPDPGSTPLAIPVEAALHYYESRGQNWERAAMIKARPLAGDIEAGMRFLKELTPYVWRKYMDFAAISDVHSIKRQIHAHRGHGHIAVRGHNVKLGRGGIREIEFFVQTQQLIAGGRFPELRGRRTVDMLAMLASCGWIDADARDALTAQYWFLREVEHAIQMVADEQSHVLPEDDEGLERIARMVGFADAESFSDAFRNSLQLVESHYAALFEAAPQLSGKLGNLVFTGDVDDPDTLETLTQLGFTRPSDICRVIRGWHFGRYRAVQSAEARERLTELTPALLEAFGKTRKADEALLRFDAFLARLPAGIQLFSLLHTNPGLLNLLATIMSAAPRLADIVTRRPHVFDGLLDPSLMSELPNKAYLAERLDAFLEGVQLHEEVLDRLRIFAAEQKFLIGIRLLTGAIDATRAGKAFSDLADLTIGSALSAVEDELALRHGKVAGGRVCILGMGKLGSRELSAGSDVDLILLYDHDPEADESDGAKGLAPSHYFARLTQRLVAAVAAPTAEGVLYELDLRLRPSGNKGPVATHVDAFRKYQSTEAWTWEHMALTRARPVAGDAVLCEEIVAEIALIVGLKCDEKKLFADAREMRALIGKEKPPRNGWDIKLIDGGQIDLEFIAQCATLAGHLEGEGITPSTAETLARLDAAFCDPQTRDELVEAHRLYTTLTQAIRLCLTGGFDPEDVPPGLNDFLLRLTDLPQMDVLESHLEETAGRVASHFKTLMGGR